MMSAGLSLGTSTGGAGRPPGDEVLVAEDGVIRMCFGDNHRRQLRAISRTAAATGASIGSVTSTLAAVPAPGRPARAG